MLMASTAVNASGVDGGGGDDDEGDATAALVHAFSRTAFGHFEIVVTHLGRILLRVSHARTIAQWQRAACGYVGK